MNDTIQIETPGTALAIIPRSQLPTILAADDKDILGSLLKELEGWEPDVSTLKGRKEIASKAQKVRVAKADFERLAKSLKEDAIKTQRNVNSEFSVLEERMNALIARVRGPLDEYEAAEEARIKANTSAIAAMEALTERLVELSSEEIAVRLRSIQPFDWSIEFRAKAERTQAGVIAQLQVAHQAAVQREAEAVAEAERQAKEAERLRLEAIEAQRVREEQIAAEAAETARKAAEERAARLAKEAEEQAQAQLQAAEALRVHQAAQAERREREAAEALALVESERWAGIERERVAAEREEQGRVDGHRDALDAIAESPGYGKTESSAEIARRGRYLLSIDRDWEEFAAEAAAAIEAEVARTRVLLDAAVARENEQFNAERIAAERRAEAETEAAIEAERQRVAREAAAQKAADEKRAADVAHRGQINREAALDLTQHIQLKEPITLEAGRSLPPELARAVITAIAKSQIRHTTIKY